MPLLFALLVLQAAPGSTDADDAKKVAVAYLNSLTGKADAAGRELLLGGATMNAQLFTIENGELQKLVTKHEEGDSKKAADIMKHLDASGSKTLTDLLNTAGVKDEFAVTQIEKADAEKLLKPTLEMARAFQKSNPVLASVCRVGKEVYWHPKNPMRAVMAKAGNEGRYTLDLFYWTVLSREGPNKTPREWPLRVLRFRAGKVDTGWKVLPASDWNAE